MKKLLLDFTLLLTSLSPAQVMQQPIVNGRAPAPPSNYIRGTSQFNSGAGSPNTAVIPIPTGSVAGDFAIIFCSSAWNMTAVSGWTTITLQNGNTWDLYVATKVLSSGDISTGSVSVVAGGNFDMAGAMITFIGATSGVREFQMSALGSGSTTLTTTSAVTSTDVGAYWATVRSNPGLSITPGAGSVLPAYTQTINTGFNITHSLFAAQKMPGGAQTNSFTSSSGSLTWAFQIIVAQ